MEPQIGFVHFLAQTDAVSKTLLRISPFIPAPLVFEAEMALANVYKACVEKGDTSPRAFATKGVCGCSSIKER